MMSLPPTTSFPQTQAWGTRSAPAPASPAPPAPRWSRRRRRTPTARSTGGRRALATSKPTASLVLRKVTPSHPLLPSTYHCHAFPAPGRFPMVGPGGLTPAGPPGTAAVQRFLFWLPSIWRRNIWFKIENVFVYPTLGKWTWLHHSHSHHISTSQLLSIIFFSPHIFILQTVFSFPFHNRVLQNKNL